MTIVLHNNYRQHDKAPFNAMKGKNATQNDVIDRKSLFRSVSLFFFTSSDS